MTLLERIQAAQGERERTATTDGAACQTCGCATRGRHTTPARTSRARRVANSDPTCAAGRCWHWDHAHHYPRAGRTVTRLGYAPAMIRGSEVPQTRIAS